MTYKGKMWLKVIKQILATNNYEHIYQLHAFAPYEVSNKDRDRIVLFDSSNGEVLRYSVGLQDGKPDWRVYTGTKADDTATQWVFDYLNQYRSLDDD